MTPTARTVRPGWLIAGAVGTSVGASLCCVGPILLALAGLSGGVAFVGLAPLRPWLLGVAFALLGAAFGLTYRRSAVECEPGSSCSPSDRRRRTMLWLAAGLVLLATVSPKLLELVT